MPLTEASDRDDGDASVVEQVARGALPQRRGASPMRVIDLKARLYRIPPPVRTPRPWASTSATRRAAPVVDGRPEPGMSFRSFICLKSLMIVMNQFPSFIDILTKHHYAGEGNGMEARMRRPERVLVIDDDQQMCDALTLVLGTAGYAVEAALSGQNGLEAFTQRPSDAVLVDLRLPDVSGLDVLRAIKAKAPATDVILMTGHGTLPTAIEAMEHAASGFLEKPVATEHLVSTIRRVVAHRRAEAAAAALATTGHELIGTLELTEVMDRIVETVLRLFDVRRAVLYAWDGTQERLTCRAIAGDGDPAAWIGRTLPPDNGVTGRAISLEHAVRSTNVLDHPGLTLPEWLRQRLALEGLGAAVGVPLMGAGEIFGALTLVDHSGREFDDHDVQLLGAFADQAAVAIRNARLYDEVRRTRDFLQSIAENSADAIVTTDLRGRITYMSPGAEAMFGYRIDEVLGHHVARFCRSGRPEARAVTRRLATDAQLQNYETALRTKDGRWVSASASISLLRDTSGARIGTVGVIKDMTARDAAEVARREASELRAIALLGAGVAHEINNTLAVVVGQLELIAVDLPSDGNAPKRIKRALAAADDIRAITARMRNITRIHTAPMEGHLPPILDLRQSSEAG
jgi:two-component system, NtrC family, sensor kinase